MTDGPTGDNERDATAGGDGATQQGGAEPTLEPATPEQVEKAVTLIRQMNVAKVRGQATIADKLLQEAVEAAAMSAPVQEALGDDLVARRQFRKAKDAYALAHRFDPTNVAIENKFGEMVLKVDFMIDPFTLAEADSGTMANGKIAVILSAMLPGLGQAVTGKWAKGIGFFLVWALGLGFVILLPGGFSGLFRALFAPGGDKNFNPLAIGGLVMAFGAWFVAIADATSASKRMTPRKVERPLPLNLDDFKK